MPLEAVEAGELGAATVGAGGREASHVVNSAQMEDERVEGALRVKLEAVGTDELQETNNR